MAYAFRSGATASAGNASGGALSLTKMTGTADGDLMIVLAYLEADTNTWTTVPSGWNTAANITQVNTGSFKLQVFWKIASGEGASWSWTPNTTGWRTLVGASYTGATGSGSTRVDQAGGSQADAVIIGSQTAPTITPTVNGDLVVFVYGNFSGANVTTTTGFATNLRISSGGVAIADAVQGTAGATGTSRPNAGPGSETYAAMHVAFFLDTGGGSVVTGDWMSTFPASIPRRIISVDSGMKPSAN